MRDKLGDKQRIQHIEQAIAEIEAYTKNVDINTFKSNSMIRFASIKQIEIIGEAARHITKGYTKGISGHRMERDIRLEEYSRS